MLPAHTTTEKPSISVTSKQGDMRLSEVGRVKGVLGELPLGYDPAFLDPARDEVSILKTESVERQLRDVTSHPSEHPEVKQGNLALHGRH